MTPRSHAEPSVVLTADGPVRLLTLNRPERHNAQTLGLWQELTALGALLVADPGVHCVVITGAGRSFSSGLDDCELQTGGHLAHIAQVGLSDPARAASLIRDIQQSFAWIRTAPFPVIAAVRGNALGAGLELALACDLRIVADDARMALPEVQRGVVPDLGGCHALRAAVGYQQALDLVLTGRTLDGQHAVAMGLALQSLPQHQVLEAAMQYAHRVARAPRPALDLAKQALVAPDADTSLAHAATGMVEGLGRLLAAAPEPGGRQRPALGRPLHPVVPNTAG